MQKSYRKNTLALAALLAIGGTALSTSAAAQTALAVPASVTIYGRLDLALESANNGSTTRTAVENFASRLGFKGSREFGADLSGLFQVETGFNPDDSSTGKPLANRNSYVGLSSKSMGTVILGTHDMPLKSMEGTATALWGQADLQELIIHGKASRVAIGDTVFNNVHTRQTNVLLYTSPKFADVVAKLAYSPDEVAPVATTGATSAPAYSQPVAGASVYWDNGTFNAGYAYQSQDNFNKPSLTPVLASGYAMTASKVTFGAKMNQWSAGVALSTLDNGNNKKTNNWMLSGAYVMGQTTLKASFGASSESSSGAADDLTAAAIEADYALDKDTTLYTYYTQINNSKNAKGYFVAGDSFQKLAKAGDTPTALGFGIRYNF
jgi:predicted porin